MFWDLFTASALDAPALGLLRTLGYEGDERPAVLGLFFLGGQGALQGPLIDDRPLSESEPIRALDDDGRNYLRWLVDAAGSSLDTLRQQWLHRRQAARALLYLLLRHALILGYSDAGRELHRAPALDDEVLAALSASPRSSTSTSRRRRARAAGRRSTRPSR